MHTHPHPQLSGIDKPAPPPARRWPKLLAGALGVAAVVAAGVLYWLDARHYESTDDAFIDGHVSQVSAQISGRVTALQVDDNQAVQAGQALVEIDPRDMAMRLDQMQAQREQAAAQLMQARATLPAREADVAQDAAQVRIDSGRMLGARYRGLDGRNRPYMITADEAQQVAAPQPAGTRAAPPDDRINLSRPVADTLGQNGSWIRISAASGVYMQHSQLLDLSRDTLLYRDDGIMMTGPDADLDLRRGIVASKDWVHAEGPFGVLDAQGYLLSQRDGLAQFRGPARLVLNDDRIARPAPAPAVPASARQAGRPTP